MVDARDVVRCGYALHVAEPEWLASVCSTMQQAFDIGRLCAGYVYAVAERSVNVRAAAPESDELVSALTAQPSDPERLELHRSEPATYLWGTRTRPDWALVCAGGTDGEGVMLGFRVDAGFRGFVAHTRDALVGVATHLAAAHRLRSAVGPRASAGEGSLVDAVRLLPDASRLGDPAKSAAEWRALCGGRWSVLDRADRDGRRLILARKNPVPGRDLLAIREIERRVLALAALGYSNKAIALELALAPSTITAHLKRGLGRLGLVSRAELVALEAQRARKV
jgi:DNA-binding CsgD family transcriptional regulator